MRKILALILCLSLQCGYSQLSDDVVLETFVEIYFEEKGLKKINETEVEAIFSKNDFGREDFELSKSPEDITSSDRVKKDNLLEDLSIIEEKRNIRLDSKLRQLCYQKKFDYSQYQVLKQKFKDDIKFHRSLKPYFDSYIKQNSND